MLLAVVHQQGLKQPCGLYAPEMRILPIVLIMHLKTKKSQSKYALRFGVLLVEQKILTANTIYANSVEIKVTRSWFAVVTICEPNNKKG